MKCPLELSACTRVELRSLFHPLIVRWVVPDGRGPHCDLQLRGTEVYFKSVQVVNLVNKGENLGCEKLDYSTKQRNRIQLIFLRFSSSLVKIVMDPYWSEWNCVPLFELGSAYKLLLTTFEETFHHFDYHLSTRIGVKVLYYKINAWKSKYYFVCLCNWLNYASWRIRFMHHNCFDFHCLSLGFLSITSICPPDVFLEFQWRKHL